ncbi:winged helix-turn-helix domain-containing protein [Chloroflexota bacterium]
MNGTVSAFLHLEEGKVDGWGESLDFPLSDEIIVIGRPVMGKSLEPDSTKIDIRNDYVSRSHLTIYYSEESASFIACERESGTQNGTFVNGKRLDPGIPYQLHDNDSIGIARVHGNYQVVFRFRESEATIVGIDETEVREKTEIRIDVEARTVRVNNLPVTLRKKEFDLLAFLYHNRRKACTRNEIAENVWSEEGGIVSDETIDTNIRRIRVAIEPEPSQPCYLITLPGFGFRLDI